ncbi:MAG: hypothetical protein PHN53_04300 [Eubacteriales bacterium]|nr:hypothetical protein [Clostridiales bacterium]MDD4139714.1 hypothetical protein [Eubacteriales bacterium]MDD4743803.1 hypothetical protein [Eubacteriales bacterium]
MKWTLPGQRVRIRQQTLQLTSSLSRWCQVREDLIYACQKCLDAGLEQPTRAAVSAFVTRVRGGMAVEQALDLMRQGIGHEHFQDLVVALRFNLRYRGDLPALLEHLAWQLSRIEEEYTRRKLSNAHDRRITGLVLLAVPAGCLLRLGTNADLLRLFTASMPGRMLAIVGMISYLAAVAAFCLIQNRLGA